MRMVAVAIAMLLLAAGCGGGAISTGSGPPQSNEKVLSPAQSQRLIRWAGSFRSCLHGRGFQIGDLEPARTRIELAVPGGTAFHALVRAGIACGDALGGPPPGSSLQTFAKRVVLYLPKQCILDRTVTTTAAAADPRAPRLTAPRRLT